MSIVHLSDGLARHGYCAEVWTSEVFGDPLSETWNGLHIRRFKSVYLSKAERAQAGKGKAALSLPMLRALATDGSIHLMHVHTHNRVASILIMLAKAKRIPTVLSLHSEFRALRPRWRYWFPNEYAIRAADYVITVNRRIAQTLVDEKLRTDRVSPIPNGVDFKVFGHGEGTAFRSDLGLRAEPLVLTPGRICEVKNQLFVLEVLPRLLESVPDVHWAILGIVSDTDYNRSLHAAITQSGLTQRVHLLPGLSAESAELAGAYDAADLVVLTSKHEAFGLVVLEAWAAGKPVVAPNVGGLSETIESGRDGLLVPPSDAEAMSAAIGSLLRDDLRRIELGRRGLRKARTYSWDEISDQVGAVYQQVLRTRTNDGR
jgi:glycosyltransferase involved in cell wall biosynthesis